MGVTFSILNLYYLIYQLRLYSGLRNLSWT